MSFALFLIGGASVLLLFIGTHNAWDTVTHLTMQRIQPRAGKAGQIARAARRFADSWNPCR